jgi:hypothetical protein
VQGDIFLNGVPYLQTISDVTVPGQPGSTVPFASQTAANDKTARIPQNLAPFVSAGTLTQAMLTDPATLLRTHISSQTITSTTVISIATDPASPLFGGGTDNIAFLLGNPAASAPNAQALKMEAVFWIETVEFTIEIPVFEPGRPPLVIPAQTGAEGQPVPEFLVTAPRTITVTATQIQYSQQVFLNFNGLIWPHVSVATLVPASPIPFPASAWI